MDRKPKVRWGTLAAIAAGVIGALGDPAVLGYLPHSWATTLTIASVVIAGAKKSIVRDEHERSQ